MRVFLDAKAVFSAANEASNLARLLDLALARHVVVTSDFALEEARRNVVVKRPAWASRFAALASRVEIVPSVAFELPVVLPAKDRPIRCAAIWSRCDLLATGDRTHFGFLSEQTVVGATIVSLEG